MKFSRILPLVLAIATCVFALALVAGCSSSTTSSASSASGSDSAASASASESAASASSEASSAAASSAASSAAASSASASASASSTAAALTAEEAVAQGFQVFEGTVYVVDAEELIKLQDIDIDPAAAGGGGTYAVLVFDEPVDVVGQGADGSGERTETALMLGIAEHTDYSTFVVEYGDLDACEALNGQHVTLAAKAQDIVFPSDVSFPIGQPKAKESIVL